MDGWVNYLNGVKMSAAGLGCGTLGFCGRVEVNGEREQGRERERQR